MSLISVYLLMVMQPNKLFLKLYIAMIIQIINNFSNSIEYRQSKTAKLTVYLFITEIILYNYQRNICIHYASGARTV